MPAPNNLPRHLTSFVGREREIADVGRLLGTTRLLTITGTGGSGKTRLALEVARGLLDGGRYPDGIWFVDLALLTDPALVPQAVALALGVREEADRALVDTVLDFLEPLTALLLLDNCEHLVESCAALAGTLLRGCPNLTICTTSREALDVTGELAWRVPSLSMPNPGEEELSIDRLAQYEAIRLFVERATLQRPDFTVTQENARWIVLLCRQLDGIPLAIELAAARTRVLTVEQIVERLDERFKLLTSSDRLALPRQQTLMALLDWSYDLLSELEQHLLCGLSVFAGGFSLEAVQAVCGFWILDFGSWISISETNPRSKIQNPKSIDEYELIDLLGRLVDKSLVVVDDYMGEARYRLLGTIRQYAWEKLFIEDFGSQAAEHAPSDHDSQAVAKFAVHNDVDLEQAFSSERGEASQSAIAHLRRRHRDWFLSLSERAENALLSRQQGEWLDLLEREHDNLRLALAWCRDDGGSVVEGLRLAGSLVWFWYFRGFLSEGRGWIESLLALPGAGVQEWPRAKALSASGALAYLQCDYSAARSRFEESLDIWREAGAEHKRGAAFVLSFLGLVAMRQGDTSAQQFGEESVALFRETGDKWGLALALDFLGEMVRASGDEERAWALHSESLTLYRELDDKWGIALELSNFGRVALRRGEYKEAWALLSESLAIQRKVGDKWIVAWTLHNMGDVARCTGDTEGALSLYGESLALFERLGDKGGLASSLHMLGRVSQQAGDWKRALALLEDSLVLSRELGDKRIVSYTLYDLSKVFHNTEDYGQMHALLTESLTLMSELIQERATSIQFSWLGMMAQYGGNHALLSQVGEVSDKGSSDVTLPEADGLAWTEGLGDKEVIVGCVEGLAEVAVAYGQRRRGARLFGAVDRLREGFKVQSSKFKVQSLKLANLDEEEWEAGRALSMDESIALALQKLPAGSALSAEVRNRLAVVETIPSPNSLLPIQETYPNGLTHREIEVLRLIALGLPDVQLAEQLSVSTRTAQAHIRSIYTKLGVNNRSAATRYAFEQKLVE